MTEWQLFPLWEPRPAGVRVYTEAEREELEMIIACQTNMLLADYAVANLIEIDNTDCIDVDGSKSFYLLDVDPFVLEDDGEIQVTQAPRINGQIDTSEGLHCIIRADEDDHPILELGVWDPDIDVVNRIITGNYERPPLETLQELYEALIVCIRIAAITGDTNEYQHDTTQFPLPIIEPEFQTIAERFLD